MIKQIGILTFVIYFLFSYGNFSVSAAGEAKLPLGTVTIVHQAECGRTMNLAVIELAKYITAITDIIPSQLAQCDPCQMTNYITLTRSNKQGTCNDEIFTRASVVIWLTVADSPEFPSAAYLPKGSVPAAGSDSFAIQKFNKLVVIVGGNERSVLFGVYDFLERLGCRWLGPGEDYVPKSTSFSVPAINVLETPAFKWRGFEYITGSTPEAVDWMTKLKMNVAWPEMYQPNHDMSANQKSMNSAAVSDMLERGLTVIYGGHILRILFDPEKYKDHPEYFAQIRGKRLDPAVDEPSRYQLCTSNPDVMRILTENTIIFLQNHPWIEVLIIWAQDTTNWCECEKCLALEPDPQRKAYGGAAYDRAASYCRMIKIIDDGVSKALPGRRLGFNHYYNLENIPKDKQGNVLKAVLPSSSLLSAWDDYRQDDRHPITDPACPRGKSIEPISKMWGPYYPESVTWTYYFAWNFTQGLPVSMVHKISSDLNFLKRLGSNGNIDNVTYEPGSIHWRNNQMNFYVYAKAMWNPTIDVNSTVSDYINCYYGPAAKPMMQAWALIEDMWTNWNQRPEYIPEDPCLVKPEFIHTKPTDILGVLYPEDYLKIIASNQYMNVQYLVPNHTAFSQLMMYLDNAQTLAGKETDSIYRFRIDLVRDVISGFDTQNRIYEVFGYLNSGGLYKYHMYQYDDAVSCSVAKGLGRGDCFWLKPLGVKQLVKVGDYAQVDVKVSYGTDIIGQATYQAGPGLYQAKDQTSPCAVKGTHSLTFLIGNQGSDTIGPRQIIVTDHNDGYATRQIRTVPNVWDYGQYVTLKVDYVSAINGKHTYRYSYKSGSNWESLGTLEFTEQLPYLAPQFFFSTVANESVNYPLIDWAQFKNFSFGSNK